MISNINDRVLQLIEDECNGNKRAFSKKVGIAPSVVENIVGSRKTKPSFDVLEKIIGAFAHISISWLVMGEGEMLIEKNCKANCEVDCKVEEKLLPELLPKLLLSTKNDKKNAQVDAQANAQVAEKYTPEYTPADQKAELELPRGATMGDARPVERGGIPLIPIEAAAGALSGSGLQALDFECEYYVIPSFKNAEFMIRITGDSMLPKYQQGDIVACQRLSLGTFFQWNNVYVVDSEQGALIKRVKRGSDKEHILLVSENRDYEPFELPLSEINGLGQVVGIVRLE